MSAPRPAAPRPASKHRAGGPPAFVRAWTTQPVSLSILRLFLGATFLYAGVQKLADPSFFDATSPQSIGSQLHSFAQTSPLRPVLLVLRHVPVVAGVGIAVLEIVIGVGALLGIGLVAAAVAGLCTSIMLWLSATWHVHPYFLGSDSIYAVAWASLLIGVVEHRRRTEAPRTRYVSAAPDRRRRELLRGGIVAGATLLVGAAARVLAGAEPTATAAARSRPRTSSGTRAPRSPNGSPPAAPPAEPRVRGRSIASLDTLNVGDATGFNDPGLGPAVLVRTGRDTVEAYSRICTHAGCEVGYDPSARILVCPCHGAEFDPSRHAQPIAGPAPTPLTSIKVAIDPSTGHVVLPS